MLPLSDGNWLVLLNLKGIYGEALGCESTSSSEMIFSIGSHATSPSSPSCDAGKGEAPLCEMAPPLFVVLHFPMIWQKCISCTVSQYPVHQIPRVHNRCKGLEFLVSVRTKSKWWACVPNPMIHILWGLSLCHLQAYPSGSWMLLLLAKPTSQEHISLSGNLWWKNSKSFSIGLLTDNQIYHTFTGLLDYNTQAVTNQLCCAHPGTPQLH